MNMHINIGDKFVAVKTTWFMNEGSVVNVTNVDNTIVSFVFNEDSAKRGCMDVTTFESHFTKIEEEAKTESPTITEEYIAEIMENSDFEIHTVFDKCTIVSCRLPNGFVITESSACVNSCDYDEDTGAEICFDKIADKIWELEAYRLQQWMWEEGLVNTCEGNCQCACDGNCSECAYGEEEIDECLDTDLDCDDCKDFSCVFNPNSYH